MYNKLPLDGPTTVTENPINSFLTWLHGLTPNEQSEVLKEILQKHKNHWMHQSEKANINLKKTQEDANLALDFI